MKTPVRIRKLLSLFGLVVLFLSPGIFAATSLSGATQGDTKIAVFAGGCFWCMQPPFDFLKGKGVVKTVVGYSGGSKSTAHYETVSAGGTGHRESVEVIYKPSQISYAKLLEVYFENIDPFDASGQFCDSGDQYTPAIFVSTAEEKKEAQAALEKAAHHILVKGAFHVSLVPFKEFFPAEDYHQDYYLKNPVRYHFYRYRCGRDARLKKIWGQLSSFKRGH